MVLNLDMRKNSYASKAHEAASRMLDRIAHEKGDILRYYSTNGTVKACSANSLTGAQLVEFYIESPYLARAEIRDETGNCLPCQVSPTPAAGRSALWIPLRPMRRKYTPIGSCPRRIRP